MKNWFFLISTQFGSFVTFFKTHFKAGFESLFKSGFESNDLGISFVIQITFFRLWTLYSGFEWFLFVFVIWSLFVALPHWAIVDNYGTPIQIQWFFICRYLKGFRFWILFCGLTQLPASVQLFFYSQQFQKYFSNFLIF